MLDQVLPHQAKNSSTICVTRGSDLFGAKYEVLLYDLTSTYFESATPEETADPRRHRLQPRSPAGLPRKW